MAVQRMSDIVDFEEAFSKTGRELFKELFRIYPVADPEDYFKANQWKNDVMKSDIQLIEAHLRECGSPDVPDLDDVKLPEMPQASNMPTPGAFQANLLLKPAGTPAGQAAITAASTPVVEIRLIALFVAKWKLDPVSSKTALAKLTPVHRRHVIQNFKAETSGAEAVKELEAYITACEADKSWDVAPANGASANGAAPFASATPSGLAGIAAAKAALTVRPPTAMITPAMKRPVVAPSPAWQQNKRPNFGVATPGVVRPPGAAVVRPPAKAGGMISGLLSGF